jgi:hypothetical protein
LPRFCEGPVRDKSLLEDSDNDFINQANPFKEDILKRNEYDYISTKNAKNLIDYVSIKSNSIISNCNPFQDRMSGNSIPTDLIKKAYIVLYFEFQYFVLWGIEYIKSIYPDNNIFILFIINDDILTKETIFLTKSSKVGEKARYNPIVKDNKVKINNLE